MKNKRGVISAGVIIGIALLIGAITAGAGYVAYKNSGVDVKVGSEGVQVKTDGVDVKTGANGVDVNAGGVNVKTGENGVSVNTGVNAQSSGFVQDNPSAPVVNTVLIFDASGSMAAQAEGGSRINVAKTAVSNYVKNLGENVNLSVVAYGHKGDSTLAQKTVSCNGIEEVYYLSPVKRAIVEEKVNLLNPNGWTPITASLQRAEEILNKTAADSQKRIVLLSDGEETCGGDPLSYASKLKTEGIIVDVIALSVDSVAAKQLSAISVNGGGSYYSVRGASDLNVVVNNLGVKINTGDVKVDVSANGANVQTGNVNVKTDGSGATVNAGGVKVDTSKGGTPSVKVPGVSIPSF
ncbi:MAG: hypothetical protein ACD_15C00225G0011 [uncultured bacterium]|nr:MAG: hypothetical protein ACD_15C00225G0011 [uncultured bacterium]